ncbi:hypothetical protein H2248_012322 [Termitomyces sp. 'cryptogamus']|nr:hypothetical protein H2248_012322 [Termitomyces sp. 'cryptogamus']
MTSPALILGLTVHWECLQTQKQEAGIMVPAPQHMGHTTKNCYWLSYRKESQFPHNFAVLAAPQAAKGTASANSGADAPTVNMASTTASHVSYVLMAWIARGDGELATDMPCLYTT